jgi:hypothetical protein
MAFGDRGRYKSLTMALHSLLPDLYPVVKKYPRAANVSGFPKQAAVIAPTAKADQLIWIEAGVWRSWILIEQPNGTTHTIDAGTGPKASVLPARWALGYTLAYYDEWLREDDPAEQVRAANDTVSLDRVFVEDMSNQIRRVVLS